MNETTRTAKPWDLLDPRIGRVPDNIAALRLSVCDRCEHYGTALFKTQCSMCKCIMPKKVLLPNASCPAGKWGVHDTMPSEPVKVAVVVDGVVVDVIRAAERMTAYLLAQPTFVGLPLDDQAGIGDEYDSDTGRITPQKEASHGE